MSSQYISALLLIASKLKNGLKLTLKGKITSVPYIKMTLALLNEIGIETKFEDNIITVKPKLSEPKNKESKEQKEGQAQTKSGNSNSGCVIALILGGLFFIFLLSQGNNSNYSTESSSSNSYETVREISKKLQEQRI